VHTVSSADPLEDLPPGAAAALQAALLQPGPADLGSVLERCDAVRELVERWQDAFFASLPDEVDVEEEIRWAAEAGMSLEEVEAQYEDDGDDEPDLELLELDAHDEEELDELVDLTAPDEDDPRRLLPEDLVTVLERELLLLPLRVRLEALVAAADLVSTWSELVADHEKLLGHLVLAHSEPQEHVGHERLVDRHAVLHRVTGPGHPVPS
jgi:DNA-binding transcriptional MerR regulator